MYTVCLTQTVQYTPSYLHRLVSTDPYLRPLIKHAAEVSEPPATGELAEDLLEELLGVHAGTARAVVLLLPGARAPPAGVEARRAVRVILLPLHLVAEHLHTGRVQRYWTHTGHSAEEKGCDGAVSK